MLTGVIYDQLRVNIKEIDCYRWDMMSGKFYRHDCWMKPQVQHCWTQKQYNNLQQNDNEIRVKSLIKKWSKTEAFFIDFWLVTIHSPVNGIYKLQQR